MKTVISLIVLCALVLLAQPAWTRCAPLIREGRELLSTAKLSKGDETKAKSLLDEAQKNLDAGDHRAGVKNANAALDILKKK